MRQIHIYPQGTMQAIELGFQGEDRARQIVFHVDEWSTGELALLYRRHGDEQTYPVALELSEDGALAVWTVTATDTAREGAGRAELWATSADSLDKSATFFTVVGKALGVEDVQGGTPGGDWARQAIQAAAEAKAAAKAVSGEMDTALGKVQEAQSRTESAYALAEDAANRTEALLSEVDDAQTAAAESASAAAGSAQAAAESAELAANAASEALSTKQDKLTGTPGQVVGFSADGSAAAVQGWSNPNLLHNWYFADPVNQRGQTTYGAAGYTIDRWELQIGGIGHIEATDGGISLVNTAYETRFIQKLESSTFLWGKTLSLSVVVDGTLLSMVKRMPEEQPGSNTTIAQTQLNLENKGVFCMSLMWKDGLLQLRLHTGHAASFLLSAAKLEFGPQQTLAHQDAGGNWVLNDSPPNKALELLKCQRYYQTGRYTGTARNNGHFNIQFPVEMRVTPDISISKVQAFTSISDDQSGEYGSHIAPHSKTNTCFEIYQNFYNGFMTAGFSWTADANL